MKSREDYNTLLNSGMFFESHPQLNGIWKQDRLQWFEIQGIITEKSSMIDKLKAYFDNETQEEIQEAWEISCYGCRKSIRDAQYSRVLHYICNLSPSLIDSELERLFKWERKYEEFQYDHRQVQTESILFRTLIKVLQENYGTEMDMLGLYDEFVNERFEAFGYVFSLFVGQGAFWRVEKDDKQIFQST